MNEEKTSQAVLEAVFGLSTTVSALQNSVSGLSVTVSVLQESVFELRDAMMAFSERVDQKFLAIDKRFDRIESNMATKQQISILTDILQANTVITKYEASQVKNASALPA